MGGWGLRDKACIVGVGTTPNGSFLDNDSHGLGAQALVAALQDAGLQAADVDGLLVCGLPSCGQFDVGPVLLSQQVPVFVWDDAQ